jgi:hypothetical protein
MFNGALERDDEECVDDDQASGMWGLDMALRQTRTIELTEGQTKMLKRFARR